MADPRDVRSMTGHGQGSSALGPLHVEVQVRTVNHRHADLRVRTGPELADHSAWIEAQARPRVTRGRAEIQVRLDGAEMQEVSLDVGRAQSAYLQLKGLRDELDPGGPLPLSLLSTVPGLFRTHDVQQDETALREALTRALDAAFGSLDEMRAREGTALARDLRDRLDQIEGHVRWVEARRPAQLEAHRGRMRARLEALLSEVSLSVDDERLERELAIFAERSDVAEELTRLDSHLTQFRAQLEGGADSIGRKLDFLVQEMGREVNTLGSKANDAEVAHRVVELKAELERVREQVQNVL